MARVLPSEIVLARRGTKSGSLRCSSQDSLPSNDYDGRLAYPQQIRRRILNTNPDRISGIEMHPVQSALNIGKSRRQTADKIGVGSDSETNAVHYSRKPHIRPGRH